MNKTLLPSLPLLAAGLFLLGGCATGNSPSASQSGEKSSSAYALTITFDTGGGTEMAPMSINPNSFLTVESPKKNGYEFMGWTLNGADIDLRTYVFQASCTLKAKWSIITYQINYVLYGGANSSSNPATYDVESEDIVLGNPSKAGFDFKGWYSDEAFFNSVKDIKKGSHGNLTLYAKWSEMASPVVSPVIETPTEIAFWHPLGRTASDLLESCIEEFEKEEPNVTVNVSRKGGYDDLHSSILHGMPALNYPDLYLNYSDFIGDLLPSNVVVDLDPYIGSKAYGWSEEEKGGLYGNVLSFGGGYAQEGTYSLPFNMATDCLYYNASALLGLDLSSVDGSINGGKPLDASYLDSLTWEELFDRLSPALASYNDGLSSSEKIIKGGSGSILGLNSPANLFITLAKQYGIGYASVDKASGEASFDFGKGEDKAKMEALLKKWAAYAEKGYLYYCRSLPTPFTLFSGQESLFYLASPASGGSPLADLVSFALGEAKIPHAEGRGQFALATGAQLAMLDHKDHNRRVATWLFMKSLYEKGILAELSENSGCVDPRKSSSAKDLYQNRTDVVSSLFVSPSFVGSDTAREEVGLIMASVITNHSEAEEKIDSWFDTAYRACLGAV